MRDDGRSPTRATEAAPGYGLRGMDERVEAVGGTLAVRSRRGRRMDGARLAAHTGGRPVTIRVAARRRPGAGARRVPSSLLDRRRRHHRGRRGRRRRARPSSLSGGHARTWCSWTSACPGLDGLEATRAHRGAIPRWPTVRVVVLTTYELDEYVYEALRAGASGFLTQGRRAGASSATRSGRSPPGTPCWPRRVTRRVVDAFARRRSPSQPKAARSALDRR